MHEIDPSEESYKTPTDYLKEYLAYFKISRMIYDSEFNVNYVNFLNRSE